MAKPKAVAIPDADGIYRKQCTQCSERVPLDGFTPSKTGKFGVAPLCKECSAAKTREWVRKHPDRRKGQKLIQFWPGSTCDEALTTYRRMVEEQAGRCFLCGNLPNDFFHPSLAVDHCHATGKVRRLLCHHCNNGLGCFKDNPDVMQRAIQYLRDHK